MTVCCQPLVGLKMTSRDQLSQWEDTGMPMSSATISVSTFASYSPDQKKAVWSVVLGVAGGGYRETGSQQDVDEALRLEK